MVSQSTGHTVHCFLLLRPTQLLSEKKWNILKNFLGHLTRRVTNVWAGNRTSKWYRKADILPTYANTRYPQRGLKGPSQRYHITDKCVTEALCDCHPLLNYRHRRPSLRVMAHGTTATADYNCALMLCIMHICASSHQPHLHLDRPDYRWRDVRMFTLLNPFLTLPYPLSQ